MEKQLHKKLIFSYYVNEVSKFSTSMMTGSSTNCELLANHDIDYSKYKGVKVGYEDFIVKDENQYYYFSFDRKGRCNWNSKYLEFSGMRFLIVEVLTQDVREEYLVYLRELGIAYIFAGENEMNIRLALDKIKSKFDLETILLCGGATFNGAFFKEDLVDEISLVIAPYMERNQNERPLAELASEYRNTVFSLKKAYPIAGGGVHLIFEKAN